MKITRIFAIGVMAICLKSAAVQAQALKNADEPAEFPPSSYSGKQYVDSRGCVYIRAGIDGLTNWVPRVSRSRKVLCGYKPTFAKAAPAKPDAKRIQNAQIITPAVAAKPAAMAAKPKARPVKSAAKPVKIARAAPKPVRKPVVRKPAPVKAAPVKIVPAPARVAAAQPRAIKIVPNAVAAPTVSSGAGNKAVRARTPRQATTCPGVTGVSRYYAGTGAGVRCGPQTEPFVTVISKKPATVMRNGNRVVVQQRVAKRVPTAVAVTAAAPRTVKRATTTGSYGATGQRLVPRHVYETQQAAKTPTIAVPNGYRPAWKDDRLNPQRAHQTASGIRSTDLAWTRTVPRKLYVRTTGLVVTHKYPGLVYPYTSMEEQRAAKAAGVRLSTMSEQPRKAKVVTRAKPRAAVKPAGTRTGGRYVQVGTFGNIDNARRSAARLQSLGLPARTGTLVKGGREYRIVLTGPYGPDQIGNALNRARRAGFSDAFVRK